MNMTKLLTAPTQLCSLSIWLGHRLATQVMTGRPLQEVQQTIMHWTTHSWRHAHSLVAQQHVMTLCSHTQSATYGSKSSMHYHLLGCPSTLGAEVACLVNLLDNWRMTMLASTAPRTDHVNIAFRPNWFVLFAGSRSAAPPVTTMLTVELTSCTQLTCCRTLLVS